MRDRKYDSSSLVEGAFDVGLADQRQEAGTFVLVHVAEAGGDVGDPVVFVPEVVDVIRSAAGTCGAGMVSIVRMRTCSCRIVVVFDVRPHAPAGRWPCRG